jgi:hypothetical protein
VKVLGNSKQLYITLSTIVSIITRIQILIHLSFNVASVIDQQDTKIEGHLFNSNRSKTQQIKENLFAIARIAPISKPSVGSAFTTLSSSLVSGATLQAQNYILNLGANNSSKARRFMCRN